MNGCSFRQVLRQSFGLVFVWVFGYLVLRDFILKPTKRAYILLNMVLGIFNSAPFEKSACFYVTIRGNFERFQYFNFETDFLENENLFKNLEYRFLVESTKIENVPLSYKTVKSEANVETNRMVSTKWTYHKE